MKFIDSYFFCIGKRQTKATIILAIDQSVIAFNFSTLPTSPKKKSSPKIEVFFSKNQVKIKKKVFTATRDHVLPEFLGFIRAGWLFFV